MTAKLKNIRAPGEIGNPVLPRAPLKAVPDVASLCGGKESSTGTSCATESELGDPEASSATTANGQIATITDAMDLAKDPLLGADGHGDAQAGNAQVKAVDESMSVGDDSATGTASVIEAESDAAEANTDAEGSSSGRESGDNSQPGSDDANDDDAVKFANGEPFPTGGRLSPEEEEKIFRQSDEAYARLRENTTWEDWKQVRTGLVATRNRAMRESGANHIKSKLYKNRFHELLELRAYAKMDATTRKALLKCAEIVPEIDEWHDQLDENTRLRLNHPVTVLKAFRKFKEPSAPGAPSPQSKHKMELEQVRQEAANAISDRDAQIIEQQKEIDGLRQKVSAFGAEDNDSNSMAEYVIEKCSGEEIKIRQVIEVLTAHLEHLTS